MDGPPGSQGLIQHKGKRGGKKSGGRGNPEPQPEKGRSVPGSSPGSVSDSPAPSSSPGLSRSDLRDLASPNVPLSPLSLRDAVARPAARDGQPRYGRAGGPAGLAFQSHFDLLPYPRGILNSSNFCFMNAILQALIFTPRFAHLAVSAMGESETCPTLAALGKWMVQYWKPGLTRLAMQSPRLPFAMGGRASQRHGRPAIQVDGSTQQDAQEFLQYLLEEINKELSALERAVLASADDGDTPASEGDADAPVKEAAASRKGWSVVKGRQTLTVREHVESDGARSLLLDAVFGGALESHLKGVSRHRDRASVVVEPFYCLPVDIGARAEITIEEAIVNTMTTERIYDSGRDKELKKTLTVHRLPSVLFLHLRRWVVTAEGELVKLDNRVVYGRQLVLPRPACSDDKLSNHERTYQLVSVVAHRGGAVGAGHYIAYLTGSAANPMNLHMSASGPGDGPQPYSRQGPQVQQARTSSSGAGASVRQPVGGAHVILCNDAKVSVCSAKDMLAETAYFLVYQRVQ